MDYKLFADILTKEMVPALGCTDPSAIAFTAAVAKSYIQGDNYTIEAFLTKNLIKNVSAVVIPGTKNICGAENAAALGAVAGKPEKELEALEGVTDEEIAKAVNMVAAGKVHVKIADVAESLYIKMIVHGGSHTAEVELAREYNNIISVTLDGQLIMNKDSAEGKSETASRYDLLSLESIVDFADNASCQELSHLKKALAMNSKISEAGLSHSYGLQVGRYLCDKEPPTADLCTKDDDNVNMGDIGRHASMLVAAGIDARMTGCPLPAMSNAGSGNQGIATTMSVAGAAKILKLDEEKTLRATAVCTLTAIYIKKQLGNLSTICGGIGAGVAFGCSLVYMLGGGLQEMIYVFRNVFGNMVAMICDGAKASCALKLASCIDAATMAAGLAMEGRGLDVNNGIVGRGEQDSIQYFVRSSNEGLSNMDAVILDIIMNKPSI